MSEGLKKVLLYLRVVMPILFIFIGVYCLVRPENIQLEPQYSKLLGYLVIAYGAFRGFRAYKALKDDNKPS